MPKTSFVPIIQEQAQKNGVIKIVGNGERRQNYIDVRDVVRLFAHIMSLPKENSNKLILIGGGVRSIKNIKIAELTAELTGARIEKSGIDNSPSFVAIDMSLPKTYEHFFTINQTLEWMQ